jgi:hypothetical protein
MRSVSGALVPGGALVLVDGQSVGYERGERNAFAVGGDYATDTTTGPQVLFDWSPADAVTTAREAGLEISMLLEHTDISDGLCDTTLVREEDCRYRRRVDGRAEPLLFTLVARRPA